MGTTNFVSEFLNIFSNNRTILEIFLTDEVKKKGPWSIGVMILEYLWVFFLIIK